MMKVSTEINLHHLSHLTGAQIRSNGILDREPFADNLAGIIPDLSRHEQSSDTGIDFAHSSILDQGKWPPDAPSQVPEPAGSREAWISSI